MVSFGMTPNHIVNGRISEAKPVPSAIRTKRGCPADKRMLIENSSYEVSGFESSILDDSAPLGDLDRSIAGCDLATGGEVDGDAFSAGSELSNPARALDLRQNLKFRRIELLLT